MRREFTAQQPDQLWLTDVTEHLERVRRLLSHRAGLSFSTRHPAEVDLLAQDLVVEVLAAQP